MTSITYRNVFESFLGKVEDYDFVNMSIDDIYEILTDYLHSVVSQPYVRRLFASIALDDQVQDIEFTMSHPVDPDADTDFVVEMLAKGVVVEWLKPQVRGSKLNVKQVFGTKEEKFFSQAQHISEIRGLLEDTENELRKMIRDRGYINNGYVDGV